MSLQGDKIEETHKQRSHDMRTMGKLGDEAQTVYLVEGAL